MCTNVAKARMFREASPIEMIAFVDLLDTAYPSSFRGRKGTMHILTGQPGFQQSSAGGIDGKTLSLCSIGPRLLNIVGLTQ
jgi:hypothetical protein